ncbi:hypothetical protein G7Y89_g11840 [Cudoniella acicularis]|uniref:Uncharacterized protein n=1 Tax=Cudoniella acicularis TaxID=354080 RepID=A0A8H4RB89_9HELO|nr:hypothetical protein G7Y89_g11840 [Cudoniella acicularis]
MSSPPGNQTATARNKQADATDPGISISFLTSIHASTPPSPNSTSKNDTSTANATSTPPSTSGILAPHANDAPTPVNTPYRRQRRDTHELNITTRYYNTVNGPSVLATSFGSRIFAYEWEGIENEPIRAGFSLDVF